MILSVSRRTDIPNYYSEWFFNRIKEGCVYVKNPMNLQQVSKIDISAEQVDCIVFWTKNPKPMLGRLRELSAYHFYFQFTLTGYGRDIECNVPHKKEEMIPIFRELGEQIGRQRVIWRYDPIIFTEKYTPEYHLKAFEQIARGLEGYTEKCIISFVDIYAKNKRQMELLGAYPLNNREVLKFCSELSQMAKRHGMTVGSCAESIDLAACGIEHNCCIDKELIENMIGCKLNGSKDKNQRSECGCLESVDIGTYNTCRNGCRYCYANHSRESVLRNSEQYDPKSLILCGNLTAEDKVSERRMKVLRDEQLRLKYM